MRPTIKEFEEWMQNKEDKLKKIKPYKGTLTIEEIAMKYLDLIINESKNIVEKYNNKTDIDCEIDCIWDLLFKSYKEDLSYYERFVLSLLSKDISSIAEAIELFYDKECLDYYNNANKLCKEHGVI